MVWKPLVPLLSNKCDALWRGVPSMVVKQALAYHAEKSVDQDQHMLRWEHK